MSAALACTVLSGCDQAAQQQQHRADPARLSPILARIAQFYPDCAGGRFLALADLETAEQAKLFRIVGPDNSAGEREQPTISILRNRNETGAGGLKAPLSGPDDRLLLDGARTEELALIRDWTAYHLLIVNIFSSVDTSTIEFSITSGTSSQQRWIGLTRIHAGWNTLRYDLADIADFVDLHDVRQLAWRVPDATGPLEIYLDDLIVTDNTRYSLGEHAATGELFVMTRGRRTVVGSPDRFEIGIANGVISTLIGDGIENLALRSGLGPLPLPLTADWAAQRDNPPAPDDLSVFSGWGTTVSTSQAVLEASPQRVVIEGRRRFAEAGEDANAPDNATQAWRYTIYPDGRIYVRLICDPQDHAWPGPNTGIALAVDGRRGFQRITPVAYAGRRTPATYALLSRHGDNRTDVLWSPSDSRLAARQLEVASADDRRLAVVAGELPAEGVVTTAHLLVVWPRDLDAAPQAEAIAGDYQQPAAVQVATGALVTDADGDLNTDGFNESAGVYELALDANVARFRLDPQSRPRRWPMFHVQGTAGRKAWVYADGRIINSQWRDSRGELLFVLPRAVATPVSVEVNCAPQR